jgi:hypothetical protein
MHSPRSSWMDCLLLRQGRGGQVVAPLLAMTAVVISLGRSHWKTEMRPWGQDPAAEGFDAGGFLPQDRLVRFPACYPLPVILASRSCCC